MITPFTDITIRQFSPDFVTITWELNTTISGILDTQLSIYRSEVPATSLTDYTFIASGINPNTTDFYLDTTVTGLTNKFPTYYYLIEAASVDIDLFSEPTPLRVSSDNMAREIIRLRELILNRHSGQDFLILKRKTYGTQCTNCYDPVQGLSTIQQCPVCYSTNYVGGFYAPISVRAQMNNQPPRSVITTYGDWQDMDGVFVTSNKVLLSPGDIIVDPLGTRWNVVTIRSTNKSYFLIAQQAQVRMLEEDSVLQKIPIV